MWSCRIPRLGDLEVLTYEEYLGGLLDFTGELNRYAVLQATARHESDVKVSRSQPSDINALASW